MNKKIDNLNLHASHVEWDSELSLYLDEMSSYEKRLREIIQKNTSTEIRKSVEHFQNQFLINRDFINKLKNNIQRHELAISRNSEATTSNIADIKTHEVMQEKMLRQKSIFSEIKHEFYRFLSKVL